VITLARPMAKAMPISTPSTATDSRGLGENLIHGLKIRNGLTGDEVATIFFTAAARSPHRAMDGYGFPKRCANDSGL